MVLTLAALAGGGVTAAGTMTPLERAASTPKGQLNRTLAEPLTNPVWIYGDDDDTLFRLIALGTGKLSPANAFGKLGYRRKGSENVVGPMPDFGNVIKTDDDLWKIIAWIRSVYCGRRAEGC